MYHYKWLKEPTIDQEFTYRNCIFRIEEIHDEGFKFICLVLANNEEVVGYEVGKRVSMHITLMMGIFENLEPGSIEITPLELILRQKHSGKAT